MQWFNVPLSQIEELLKLNMVQLSSESPRSSRYISARIKPTYYPPEGLMQSLPVTHILLALLIMVVSVLQLFSRLQHIQPVITFDLTRNEIT